MNFKKIIAHIKQHDKKLVDFFIIILILSFFYFLILYYFNIDISIWQDIIDPIVTLLTAGIAILVYLINKEKEIEDNLPKLLTVHLKHGDEVIMSCYKATLTSEGDIRNWGQQIGRQINGGADMKFYPFMEISNTVTETSKEYTLIMYLKEMPNGNILLSTNYIVWIDNDAKSPKNIELLCGEKPNQPYPIEQAIEKHNENPSNKRVIYDGLEYTFANSQE